jgi:hypothetical protein
MTDAAPAPFNASTFLSTVWRLSRPGAQAECALYSHLCGWELRLIVGPSQQRRVCRSHDELFDAATDWKRAMLENGWS